MRILGTGAAVPEYAMTNQELEQMVDTSDEWIVSRTGIRTRHIARAEAGETNRSLSAASARRAIEAAGINPASIGVVICATFTADQGCPSTACCLQHDLGLREDILAFDLNAACSGFIYALITAHGVLKEDEYALVIGTDLLSPVTNFTDRNTCVLFGDGSGAAIVGRSANNFEWTTKAHGDDKSLFVDQIIHMDGREVFRFAVETLTQQIEEVCKRAKVALHEIDTFVCHQANQRILASAAKRLAVPFERFVLNVSRFGNTSAASVPLALHDAVVGGMLRAGNKVVLAGFGGGLTAGAIYLEWS